MAPSPMAPTFTSPWPSLRLSIIVPPARNDHAMPPAGILPGGDHSSAGQAPPESVTLRASSGARSGTAHPEGGSHEAEGHPPHGSRGSGLRRAAGGGER